MSVAKRLPEPWTVEDFLAWERRQPERYEMVRSGDEWTFRIVEPPETLHLPDIGAELRLDDIYEDSGR